MRFLSLLSFFFPSIALAADTPPASGGGGGLGDAKNLAQQVGIQAYGPSADKVPLEQVIGQIVQSLLGVLGVIFLCLTVYAGYKWMLARGNEKDVEEAKSTLRNAVIGLAITLGGYIVTDFVINRLVSATTGATV